jgi:hypothetical protein
VQHGGVALVGGGHAQGDHAHGDEAEQAGEGGEQREFSADGHEQPRVGAGLKAR